MVFIPSSVAFFASGNYAQKRVNHSMLKLIIIANLSLQTEAFEGKQAWSFLSRNVCIIIEVFNYIALLGYL
jgi:hypothetical protein